jgi:VWFA-related protein
MSVRRVVAHLISVAATAAALVTAAGPGAAARPQREPAHILRATTRLVQVEVIVRDGSGKPVTGLKQGDFDVREDGKPQDIRFFTGYAEAPKRTQDLLPGMVSNRPDITGPRRGVTVILIDSLNTNWRYKARALINLRKFLDGAEPDDRVAIYTLGSELKVFHEFTGDVRSLRQKMDRYKSAPVWSEGDEALIKALMAEDMAALLRWSLKTEEEARTVARAQMTFDSLEQTANRLGSTPGWKSLVWISSGIPLQYGHDRPMAPPVTAPMRTGMARSFEHEFERAVRALTNSNVAVYPIDPAGLQALPTAAESWQSLQTDSMFLELAAKTGGRAYVNLNDIEGALKQVTDAAQASYTVAYYPSDTAFDGRYRKIEVRMKKAGLTANHRQGYYALDLGEVTREDADKAIRAAALDPLDTAVIGIDAGLQAAADGPQLLARIDAAELLWPQKGGFEVRTSVGVFQYDGDGRQLAGVVDAIDFTCDAARAELLSRHGLSYSRKLTLAPGAASLRLVVRSARTGVIGSLTVPVPR